MTVGRRHRWRMSCAIRMSHPDAIIPDLSTNTVARFTKDQVAFVYGSKWKQRYFTKIGDDYYPLPAQWDVGNKTWRPYHVPDTGADWWTAYYPSDNMQRPTGSTCDGCHSVTYDIHTKQVAEWNVGCERCHGPGSEHVAHPLRANILESVTDGQYRHERHLYCLPLPRTASLSTNRRQGVRLAGRLPRWSSSGGLLETRRSHTRADNLHSISRTGRLTKTGCRAMILYRALCTGRASPAPLATTYTAPKTMRSFASPQTRSASTATVQRRRTVHT